MNCVLSTNLQTSLQENEFSGGIVELVCLNIFQEEDGLCRKMKHQEVLWNYSLFYCFTER